MTHPSAKRTKPTATGRPRGPRGYTRRSSRPTTSLSDGVVAGRRQARTARRRSETLMRSAPLPPPNPADDHSAAELAHRRFELIVEHSTDVISILGRGGEWLYSSPAGTR